MKKTIMLLFATVVPMLTSAETNENDTIVIKKPQKVTVITGDSIQTIIVKGKEDDDLYEYRNTIQLVDSNYVSSTEINKDSWSLRRVLPSISMSGSDEHYTTELILGGSLLIGFTAPTHTAPGTDFSTFSSWEFALPFISSHHFFDKKKRTSISLNTFFNWRNYRMTGDRRFVKGEDGNVILDAYPEGAKPKFSRIKVFSLSGALLFEQRFSKEWGIALGPVINFNTYASIKTRYKKDGGKFKDVEKDINQRKVTFDFMGVIKTPEIDLYLKYSPNSVLKDGVRFRSLTFGLCL
jgi:hypothetical protein